MGIPAILLAYPKDFPLCTYSDREFSSKSLVYVNKCLGSEWRSSLHVFIAPFIALYADSCWFVHLGNRVCTLLYVSKNKLLTSSERPTSIPVFFLFYYSLRYFWVRSSPELEMILYCSNIRQDHYHRYSYWTITYVWSVSFCQIMTRDIAH